MRVKILLTAMAILFSTHVFAESATTSTYLKEKLKLSMHAEFGMSHQTDKQAVPNKFNNFTQFYNPTIGWNFRKDINFTVVTEFKYASVKGTKKFPDRFYRGLATLTKSDVLTEKENGVKLNLGLARRYFDRVAVPDTYGNNRIIATLAKTMNNLSVNLPITYLHNDPKDKSNDPADPTWKHGLELTPDLNYKITDKLSFDINDDINIFTPWSKTTVHNASMSHESYGTLTYQFTDKYSGYTQYHYVHTEDFTKPNFDRNDSLGYLLGTGINVAKSTVVTLEMGSDLFTSNDHKTFADTWKHPDFTVYFDWSF